jgi:hypothetical protein
MTTVAKKLLLGTAAFAVAGALMSPVVAVADNEDPGTDTASVGTSAGNTPQRGTRGARGAGARAGVNVSAPSNNTPSAPVADAPDAPAAPEAVDIPTVGADATADALGSNPLIQNPLIWIGTPNPAPPPGDVIYEFEPLADMPGYQRAQFGWMRDFEFEACVLGLSSVTRGQTVAGPSGTATTGFSSSGCA